jgi:hypothetical protein
MYYPDIESRRKSLGKELIGRLHFLPASKKIVLAPMYRNFESIDYEQEKAEIMTFDGPISFEELGRHAFETLLDCERKDRNLRNYKMSEWPAYRASGMRSIRQFEKSFIRTELRTHPCYIEVEGSPTPNGDIHVGGFVTISALDADLGSLILRIVRCCQKLHSERLA